MIWAGSELLREMPGRGAVVPRWGELPGDCELKTVLDSKEGMGPNGDRRRWVSFSPAPGMPAKLGAEANPFMEGRSVWFGAGGGWLRVFSDFRDRRFLRFGLLALSL